MTRILVVEDEPSIALGLQSDLTLEGYEVEVVRDGEHAIRRARESSFDLILLDVMLPKKDGFAVCRELRRSGVSPQPCVVRGDEIAQRAQIASAHFGGVLDLHR